LQPANGVPTGSVACKKRANDQHAGNLSRGTPAAALFRDHLDFSGALISASLGKRPSAER